MRMTDERLAELDAALNEEHGRMFYAAMADELLQALKEDRKHIEELEARLDAARDLLEDEFGNKQVVVRADHLVAALEEKQE